MYKSAPSEKQYCLNTSILLLWGPGRTSPVLRLTINQSQLELSYFTSIFWTMNYILWNIWESRGPLACGGRHVKKLLKCWTPAFIMM